MIVFEDKVPRPNWCLGRIKELIPSRDNQIRGAKILIGKSKVIIERPINKLYPIECARGNEEYNKNENESYDNTIEKTDEQDDQIADNIANQLDEITTKRNLAILADIRMKYVS